MDQRVDDVARRDADRKRHPVADVELAVVGNRRIDGQHQGLEPSGAGAFDRHQRGFHVAPDIELIPLGAATLGEDGLHRRIRRARQRKRDAGFRRGARQRGLAAIPGITGRPGRADHQRQRLALAK